MVRGVPEAVPSDEEERGGGNVERLALALGIEVNADSWWPVARPSALIRGEATQGDPDTDSNARLGAHSVAAALTPMRFRA
ncbi:MAG TPA: hypothetical protein VJA66_14485 [Thermoanaerobaculia bacterium]